jgi:hypothetical protein
MPWKRKSLATAPNFSKGIQGTKTPFHTHQETGCKLGGCFNLKLLGKSRRKKAVKHTNRAFPKSRWKAGSLGFWFDILAIVYNPSHQSKEQFSE